MAVKISTAQEGLPSDCVRAQSCPTLCYPMDSGPPGFSVHGIFQAKYWSGLPFLSLGDLPDPGIKPRSPALQADFLPSELQRAWCSMSPVTSGYSLQEPI